MRDLAPGTTVRHRDELDAVQKEFGRRTRTDQTSCNTDYSYLDGDCPSFLAVQVATGTPRTRVTLTAPAVPDPVLAAGADLFLTGDGGTGIVTVNQLLATAALRSDLAPPACPGSTRSGCRRRPGR